MKWKGELKFSINPITAAVDRAAQNSTCCLPLPGQSQQDKLGHTSCKLHISKLQPETAASPGCPSLPCLSSSPSSFLLPAGICNFHSADRTGFVFSKYNKQMHRNGNAWVTSGWEQAECAQQSRAARKDRRCQEGSEVSSSWRWDSFTAPSERHGLYFWFSPGGPATNLPTKHTAWDFLKRAEAKKQEKHKLLLWPWLLSWLIIVSLKMKVTGLKI